MKTYIGLLLSVFFILISSDASAQQYVAQLNVSVNGGPNNSVVTISLSSDPTQAQGEFDRLYSQIKEALENTEPLCHIGIEELWIEFYLLDARTGNFIDGHEIAINTCI